MYYFSFPANVVFGVACLSRFGKHIERVHTHTQSRMFLFDDEHGIPRGMNAVAPLSCRICVICTRRKASHRDRTHTPTRTGVPRAKSAPFFPPTHAHRGIAVLFSTSLADEKGREIGKRPEMARRSRITFSFQFRRGGEGECWRVELPDERTVPFAGKETKLKYLFYMLEGKNNISIFF